MIKLKKIQINYKKIILDFIPAFLGVLVALILSNWNEHRKENEFIKKSIVSIYNDNKTNLEHIEFQLSHLESHIDTFDHYKNSSLNIIDLIVKNNGITTKEYIQTGWNILENSKLVTKIDYELLTKLSDYSKTIGLWGEYKKRISSILYSSIESRKVNDKKRMSVLFRDAHYSTKKFKYKSEQIDSLLKVKYADILD
jgi:hypothetical protein